MEIVGMVVVIGLFILGICEIIEDNRRNDRIAKEELRLEELRKQSKLRRIREIEKWGLELEEI